MTLEVQTWSISVYCLSYNYYCLHCHCLWMVTASEWSRDHCGVCIIRCTWCQFPVAWNWQLSYSKLTLADIFQFLGWHLSHTCLTPALFDWHSCHLTVMACLTVTTVFNLLFHMRAISYKYIFISCFISYSCFILFVAGFVYLVWWFVGRVSTIKFYLVINQQIEVNNLHIRL